MKLLISLLTVAIIFVPTNLNASTEIRIAIVYGDKTDAEYDDLNSLIETVEKLQNSIFSRSGMSIKVDLVPQYVSEFNESEIEKMALAGCSGHNQICILKFLESNASKYGIDSARAASKADLVSVWMYRDGWYTKNGSAGKQLEGAHIKSWEETNSVPDEAAKERYLTVILSEKVWLWWHFAHEIGHNLGAGHHKSDVSPLSVAAYHRGDSFGYVNLEFPFLSIMFSNSICRSVGVQNCPRLPFYSNSNSTMKLFGLPMGDAESNNVATISAAAPLVAQYSVFLDLRPNSPPVFWRIRRYVFDLRRPVFAIPFSWRIHWA